MVELSLAPMMKITTPQFRLFLRKVSSHVILFTEMIVSSTVLHVTVEKLNEILGEPEAKTVVQIGGSDPDQVAESVRILKEIGWKHFNLNCGCPSDRVKSGMFGAVLMLMPERVVNIINRTYQLTGIVLSLKIRTGVDSNDSYEFLRDFIYEVTTQTPCDRLYIHARKCWLSGVSPKHNRNVPPLNYDAVYRIKEEMPHLFISLNGGIKENGMEKLRNLDGLMVGRHAWTNINIFNEIICIDRFNKLVVEEYLNEAESMNCTHSKLLHPLLNLRKGCTGSRAFKQKIDKLVKEQPGTINIYKEIETFLD